LGQVSLVSIIPQMLHTHIPFIYHRCSNYFRKWRPLLTKTLLSKSSLKKLHSSESSGSTRIYS